MKGLLARRAIRSIGLAATMTSLARVAGLASQALLVARFGAGAELDGFLLTLIAPALIVVPLAGAFELAIPAAFTRTAGRDRVLLRSRVLLHAAVLGSAATVIVLLVSPLLVRMSGPGADPEVLEQARSIAQIVYAGVGFRIVSAAASGLLLGDGRITAPVMARLANPAAFVVFLVASSSRDPQLIAFANLTGDVVEAALSVGMVLLSTRRGGEDRTSDSGTDVLHVARRSVLIVLPSMIFVQLVPVVDQAFVSSLGPGALTTFVLATRLFEAVRSVAVIPFLRVAQRRVAGAAASGIGVVQVVMRQDRRRSAGLGLLGAIGLLGGAPAITLLVFENGSFDRTSSLATIRVAIAMVPAIGLTVFHGYFGRALVALGEARRASRYMLLYVVCNIGLDFALIGPAGAPGIALATSGALGISVLAQRRRIDGMLRG